MILFFAGCLGLGLAPGMNAQTSGPTLKKVAEFDLPGPGANVLTIWPSTATTITCSQRIWRPDEPTSSIYAQIR